MKKIVFVIVGLVLFFAGSFAITQMASPGMKKMTTDNDVRNTILEKPETSLKAADAELKTALEEKDAPVVIDALIRRTVSQMLISRDSFPSLLSSIDKVARSSKNPVERSVLFSMLSELYSEYYNANKFTIGNRPGVVGEVSGDMNEWSGNIFADTILYYNSLSLQPVHDLQSTPVEDYKMILRPVYESSVFYPTMYDFIAMRAVDIYEDISSLVMKYEKQQSVEEKFLWLPADEFVKQEFPSGEEQTEGRILRIYQELLRFHGNDKLSASYIMSDLNRLSYVSSLSYEPKNYEKALEQLLEVTSDSPYSCEIVAALVKQYRYNEGEKEIRLKKALDLCNRYILRFPHYERIDCLKEERKQLLSSYVRVSIPNTVYPGKSATFKISYKNVPDAMLSIYRYPESFPRLNYSLKAKKLGGVKPLFVQKVSWDNEHPLIAQDTSVYLPPLNPGIYALKVQCGDSVQIRPIVVSRLMAVFRNIDGIGNLYVTDSKTGCPLSGVKVQLYSKVSNSEDNVPVTTLRTDKNGMVAITNNKCVAYQLSLKEDFLSPIQHIYLYKEKYIDSKNVTVSLFTDRSVYRPGQTVYYSAIVWSASEKVRKVFPEKKYKVNFYNASGLLISSSEKETDEFGSFSGSFFVPKDVMNGVFSIEVENKASKGIHVAQYKRPQFQISFDPVKELYAFGRKVTLKGNVKSYSGAAIANSKLTYTITRKPNWWYRFYIYDRTDDQVANGTLNTSEDGGFSISFVPEKGKASIVSTNVAYNYEVNVSVTSASGETQDAVYTIPVGDTPLIVNVGINGNIDKDIPVFFDVKLLNLSGQPVYRNCKYVLYTLYDKPFKTGEDSGEPLDSLKVKMQIAEGDFDMQNKPEVMNWENLPSGPYKLVVMTKDDNGRIVTGESRFVLYSKKDKKPALFSYLWVPETNMSVKEGEEAQVIFGSSCKDAYLIYEIYDGMRLVTRRLVNLSDKNQKLSIPYKREYGPELSVYVMMVKNGKLYDRMMRIKRETPSDKLIISTTTFRDKLMPGAVEKWSFSVKDGEGNPVSAQFMAEMYDASLNAISPHNWSFIPVPVSKQLWFYPRYPYNNISWLNLFYNNDTAVYSCTAIRPVWLNMYDISLFQNYYEALSGRVAGFSSQTVRKQNVMESADIADFKEVASDNSETMQKVMEPSVYRQNMNETAFFYPQLRTDSTGIVSFEFTVPESNTEWDFMALAFTKDLQYGNYKNTAVSSKPLMVAPNMPRFVRQGDEVSIGNYVQNISENVMEGKVTFELFDPYSEKILLTTSESFILKANESKNVNFNFSAPENVELLGYRVKAVTPLYSDGEQQLLPVLPSRILITESQPFYIDGGDKNTVITVPGMVGKMKSASLQNYRLTLEYCDNPVWYVVQALPALTQPESDNAISVMASYFTNTVAEGIVRANPRIETAIKSWKASPDKGTLTSMLDKNEELKNILLSETPWVLDATTATARMQQLSTLLDRNRIRALQSSAIRKLRILQSHEGGWSWFKGMNSSVFITLNVLDGFSRLSRMNMAEYGNEVKQMQIQALNYVDNKMVEQQKGRREKLPLTYDQICYLYVRSQYRDIPLAGDILDVHKQMMDRLVHDWKNYSLTEKAYTAMALYNYGFKNDALQVVSSLREYATTTTKMGMFWQNNRSSYFYKNGAVQMNCAIYDAFNYISPVKEELDNMRRWLLMQKQTQEWGTVPATMDAIYFLLKSGTDWLQSDKEATTIKWGGKPLDMEEPEILTGYEKYVKTTSQITPADATVEIKTSHSQPSWGAIYWQYFDNIKNITKSAGSDLAVTKRLFVNRITETGSISVPINQTGLHVGDRVIVQLTVVCSRDMDYVCLKDQRAACLEPVEQLSAYQYDQRVGYYKEVKDASVNYFFDFLPKGTYVFSYMTDVERAGEYENGISSIQCLYAPQIKANTQGGEIIVK